MGSTYFISELDTYSTFLMLARARSASLGICLHTYPAQRHGQSQSREVGRIRTTSTLTIQRLLLTGAKTDQASDGRGKNTDPVSE
jgi:hypothetical protein